MEWDNTEWKTLLNNSNDETSDKLQSYDLQPYQSPTVVNSFEQYKANGGEYPTGGYTQVEAQTDPRFIGLFDDNGNPINENTNNSSSINEYNMLDRKPLSTGVDLSDPNSGSFLADYYKGMLSLADRTAQQKYDILKNNLAWQKEQHNLDLQFQRDINNQQQAFARSQWNDQMGIYQKNLNFQKDQFNWTKEIQQANLDFQKEQFNYNKKLTDWELEAKKWALGVQKDEYNRKSALRDKLTASYGGN